MSIFGAGAGGVTAGAESRFGEGNSTTAAFANGAISFAGALAGELIGGQLGGIIGGGVGGFLGSITAAVRAQVQADLAHGRAKPALIKTKTLRPMSKGDTINIDVTRAAVYIVRNPLDVAMSYAHH
jgi:hypothetical protein